MKYSSRVVFPPIDRNGHLITGYNGADPIATQNIIT
jgi:hypothetical protein